MEITRLHVGIMGEFSTVCVEKSTNYSSSSGIFAYLNFFVGKKRQFILETLINGLKRLEYRGYDSAGKYVYVV